MAWALEKPGCWGRAGFSLEWSKPAPQARGEYRPRWDAVLPSLAAASARPRLLLSYCILFPASCP